MTLLSESVGHAYSEKDWLDQRVSRVYESYCGVFGIRKPLKTISRYWISNTVLRLEEGRFTDTLVQDIPIEYLNLDEPDRTAKMISDKAAEDKARADEERRDKLIELNTAETKAGRLRRELGLPQRPHAET